LVKKEEKMGTIEKHLQRYFALGLIPIPIKRRSKKPYVKWLKENWQPSFPSLTGWLSRRGINWAVRCGAELAVLDFDGPDCYDRFIFLHPEAASWPTVETGRGFHIWVKPRLPWLSQTLDGFELKCIGSYVVAPPSIHPTGKSYTFQVYPKDGLPVVDLELLLGCHLNRPSEPAADEPWDGEDEVKSGWQKEFRTLFATLGVHPGENPTWCPWHPDREGIAGREPQRSLSVDWQKCVFKCHSPRCGEKGGLTKLRALASRPNYPVANSYAQDNSHTTPPIPDSPPWDAWGLEEPPANRCGMPILLRHRQNRQDALVRTVFCGKWNCGICGPYLKTKWNIHLGSLLLEAEKIFFSVIDRSQWSTFYRRLQRAGGEYAKIELESGDLVVLTTADEGMQLPASIRLGVLKDTIDAATFRHRAISTSRGWTLPKREDEDPPEWEMVSVLPGTVARARKVAVDLGLNPRDFSYGRPDGTREGFKVEVPASWLENDELGYKRFIGWLQYVPESGADAEKTYDQSSDKGDQESNVHRAGVL